MSSKFVTSPNGNKLPLLNFKGKDYLQGAYRLVWLNEAYKNFDIKTEFLLLTNEETIARTTLTILDEAGKPIKTATATKRETRKDFADHTEKAESSSLFRALSFLGIGTQFATAELDEGDRIADSPVETKTPVAKAVEQAGGTVAIVANADSSFTMPEPVKIPKFGKKQTTEAKAVSGDLE